MQQNTFHIIMIVLSIFIIIPIIGLVYLYSACASNKNCPVKECPVVQCPLVQNVQSSPQMWASERDRRVISDPLYPAYNRTDAANYNSLQNQVSKGNLYKSEDSLDNFRLIGYLTPSNNDTSQSWKLFARMKDRSQGEFYISSTNTNVDMKIPLTKDMMVGQQLKDIYTIPTEMQFNSPLLDTSPYKLTELPKGDIGSRYN
jgi:hypothetical protein